MADWLGACTIYMWLGFGAVKVYHGESARQRLTGVGLIAVSCALLIHVVRSGR